MYSNMKKKLRIHYKNYKNIENILEKILLINLESKILLFKRRLLLTCDTYKLRETP